MLSSCASEVQNLPRAPRAGEHIFGSLHSREVLRKSVKLGKLRSSRNI